MVLIVIVLAGCKTVFFRSISIRNRVCSQVDRFASSTDLDEIGISDILSAPSVTLVEWPERLQGYPIPDPALIIRFEIENNGDQRQITAYRPTTDD